MRLKRHVSLFQSNLKRHVSARPLLSTQCLSQRRRYAQAPPNYPENIAVLGAGVSGLASAHFLSKEFPKSKITVIDRAEQSGGWIKSKETEVDGGKVLLEYGPRTLRPGVSALPTVKLIEDLGLTPEVLFTDKQSVSAKNRYIYYPDRLNCLPSDPDDINIGTLWKLHSSGIIQGLLSALAEPWRPPRPKSLRDESVGDFISRRANPRIAENIVSAVFHGIYAGDIFQLSAKTLMQLPWRLEGAYGSIVRGLVKANTESETDKMVMPWSAHAWEQYEAIKRDLDVDQEFVKKLSRQSTFYFKKGMQQLTNTMEQNLRDNEQVTFSLNTNVANAVRKVKGEPKLEVDIGNDKSNSADTKTFDFVVSTLPQEGLAPAVTVMVVNLWFRNPDLVPVKGFGYLIPRSVPFEQNPERALGVIFDHDAVTGQDTVQGTKLTVMIGGHWWDGWEGYPDDEEGKELARGVVARHLGIRDEPEICQVSLHRNAIPQYTVGYEERAKTLDSRLKDQYAGKLRVVGAQYNGVGVNDCVRGAWELVQGMKGNGWRQRKTGLEHFTDSREDVLKPAARMLKELPRSES